MTRLSSTGNNLDHQLHPGAQAPSSAPAATPRCIRVVMIDDNALAVSALERYMSARRDVTVVATATDAKTGILRLGEVRPDVVILDFDMPGYDTVATIRSIVDLRIHADEMAVVMFSGYCGVHEIGKCLEAGASGYICKEEPTNVLIDLLKRAAGGEVVFSPMAAKAFLGNST